MSIIGKFESLTQKQFSTEDLSKYMGKVQRTYLTYATNKDLRKRANSGGSVTAILAHLLESNVIDGAIVNESFVEGDQLHNRFIIARDRESLIHAQGSKYISVKFTSQAVPLIRSFDGKLAVVALPCDASILAHLCQKDASMAKKIALVITLFCGHNSQPILTERYINKWKMEQKPLKFFQHKTGLWRGKSLFLYNSGEEKLIPFSKFGTYQNLYFFSERKCLNCHDHFGYDCDMSAGDVWINSMKDEAIKPTAIVVRSDRGAQALQDCIDDGSIVADPIQQETVMQGQSRTALFHYQVSARHRVGKLFKLNIPDTVNEKVGLFDVILAFLVLLNYKVSKSKLGQKIIFKLPLGMWKVYLYLIKGLESL